MEGKIEDKRTKDEEKEKRKNSPVRFELRFSH